MNREDELEEYKKAAAEHRGSVQQLCWGSKESQLLRFDVILSILEKQPGWKDFDVLDFGCGRGELLPVLDERGFLGSYTGVDGVEANIQDAKETNKGRVGGARFVNKVWSGLPDTDIPRADAIIVSGSLNMTDEDRKKVIVRRLLERARRGVILNCLQYSDRIPGFAPNDVLTSISQVVSVIDVSEFKVVVRADYLPHDFTVGAFRW